MEEGSRIGIMVDGYSSADAVHDRWALIAKCNRDLVCLDLRLEIVGCILERSASSPPRRSSLLVSKNDTSSLSRTVKHVQMQNDIELQVT
jgi:hypothetical protein